MAWCPNCRIEYREGFTHCNDCEVQLVEQLEPINITEFEKEVLLVTVSNTMEANIVESLLKSYDIPVMKKHRESGGYIEIYMGMTNFGIDIYVTESLFQNAKEILESQPEDPELLLNELEEEEFKESEEKFKESRINKFWVIIFIVFILPILIVLLLEHL